MNEKLTIELLEEIIGAHRCEEDHMYNECDIDECQWCEEAKEAIELIRRRMNTHPTFEDYYLEPIDTFDFTNNRSWVWAYNADRGWMCMACFTPGRRLFWETKPKWWAYSTRSALQWKPTHWAPVLVPKFPKEEQGE